MAVEAAPTTGRALEEATTRRPPSAHRGDRVRSWALGIWSVLALTYLFIPVAIVVLFSFNENKGRFNFTWQGFTLDHWAHPFANPDLATALQNSIEIALLATLLSTALGTFM